MHRGLMGGNTGLRGGNTGLRGGGGGNSAVGLEAIVGVGVIPGVIPASKL